MSDAILNLIVIRANDIEKSRAFYEALGLIFTKERHGDGPEHFASQTGSVVLEIYPRRTPGKPQASAMLGFRVESVDRTTSALTAAGAEIVTVPQDGPTGRRAVARDPDGHRIELSSV